MTEKLKNITSELIDIYINILEQEGEPKEEYKYLAINTFQENWNLEAGDFHQMFKASFIKVDNLLHPNSVDFIKKSAENFPEETREMFRKLYDNSVDVAQRIKDFQANSKELLPRLKKVLNRENFNAQQDERTISVYLAFRYPEKYIIYKSDYYEKFCDILGIKPQKTGLRFLHFQELADQILDQGILDNEFIKNYRKFYPKLNWEDKYLMIQNILFVVFWKAFKKMKNFKDFLEQLRIYIEDKKLDYKLGERGGKWRWIFDKDEYFNNKYVHYELLLVENKISIDLHFEKDMEVARKFHTLIGELPDFLEWKKWRHSVDSITHKNKIDLDSEDCIPETVKALNELFEYTYPRLVEKAKLLKGIPDIGNSNSESKTPLNQILFGAPGTGKTYNTKKIAVEIINGEKVRTREEINAEYESLVDAKQILFTTFHQSLSYEDFIEGIKPSIYEGDDENKSVIYEIKDGIFKELCRQAQVQKKKSKDESEIYDFDSAWNDLIEEVNESLQDEKTLELPILTPQMGLFVTEITNQGNLKLKPKSSVSALEYTVSYNRAKKLQEHFPDLSVIKNIDKEFRAVIGGSNSTSYWAVLNYINNKISSNQKDKIEETLLPPKRYVLIIDEINRGNVSAIFGELITLLEEDKRKGNKEQTEVILPYSNDIFSVPNNVYIVGTMNTADRSVEALDTALRRRFSFTEVAPDPEILSDSEYRDVDLKQLLATINQRIEVLIDKDHQIGHSYFIGIRNLDDLKVVFRDQIIPLLEEYFYSDFGKIGLVLGRSFISEKENAVSFPKNFKYEHDFLEDKKIYRFTPFENWNESTFTSVYQD